MPEAENFSGTERPPPAQGLKDKLMGSQNSRHACIASCHCEDPLYTLRCVEGDEAISGDRHAPLHALKCVEGGRDD